MSSFPEWSASSQGLDPGRKGRGAFSTPRELAEVMAQLALTQAGELPRVLDPSVGHGALLLAVFAALRERGATPAGAMASLHGVELDPQARELCCLMLWLAAADPGVTLADIGARIVLGNALTGSWSAAAAADQPALFATEDPAAAGLRWDGAFARAFGDGGFDVVVSNPPWESLRQQDVEGLDGDRSRAATHERLSEARPGRPGLPPLYSHQGRGDRNLYKGFVELFPHLLREGGRLVALLPGAFASDLGMQPARALYLQHMTLEQWTGFENLHGYFPIDSRYKFGIAVAVRVPGGEGAGNVRVRFMAREASQARERRGHVTLSRRQLITLGGPSLMLPEVSDAEELGVLATAAKNGSAFFDEAGSFGRIDYRRELDLTMDRKAGRFMHVTEARERGFCKQEGGVWSDGAAALVPLVEGRMVGAFEFFEKSWSAGAGRSAKWSPNAGRPLEECQSQFLVPRTGAGRARLAICDVTSATNTRTMLATYVPRTWTCGNTAPVLELGDETSMLALLAVLNSMTFDWILRRIAAGLHLNRFYLEATPLPAVSAADREALAAFASHATTSARYTSLSEGDRLEAGRRECAAPETADVEAVIARGYGLTARHMQRVMSDDRRDRKGLWRFFDATPAAAEAARRTVRLLRAA